VRWPKTLHGAGIISGANDVNVRKSGSPRRKLLSHHRNRRAALPNPTSESFKGESSGADFTAHRRCRGSVLVSDDSLGVRDGA